MSTIAKTIVATGATSGLGFELVKQLLAQTQPYKFILGARDTKTAQAAYDGLKYDGNRHSLTIVPLELSNLRTVKTFSQQVLDKVGQDKVDYLLLNAAIAINADEPGPHGSKWSEAYIVNHLSQHYLIHLLREKLESSRSRIVVVSSGAVRMVKDTSLLDNDVKGASKTERSVYSATKFIQLLGAHWWRRQLQGKCDVVAVSPGLIPGTGLPRGTSMQFTSNHPDAKSIPEGAQSILRAFTRDDFPEDPDQIFLTSWGEWWPKDVFELSLDKNLQDKWSPSKDEIEKEEGLTA
ncbi:NAD(P)-binding protein [Annulohypoxylon maeteangense]|uniref:NAD(P)-binding protein n=1 Tax=Annulohypoxylon maeteangense TaxID=1927788 RepID=UPI002007C0EB|nr:NAD(P)-binding protein [Annulohypoxylon maeteangense]KAI0884766.1 NAD(P)-binding protein [Annulohypoxylon maeteangense]